MANETETASSVQQTMNTSNVIHTDIICRDTDEYRYIDVSSSTRGKGKVLVPRKKNDAPTSVKIAALSNMYVLAYSSCRYDGVY